VAARESFNNVKLVLTVALMLYYSAQVNPLTAYCMLEVLNIPKGGYVVFSAAGSALSRMGIHLAKHSGLKTIGIVRRDEQREERGRCFTHQGDHWWRGSAAHHAIYIAYCYCTAVTATAVARVTVTLLLLHLSTQQ
jgi:hypothetical protein